MTMHSIPMEQIPDTIVRDLTDAGLLGPGSAVGFMEALKTYDENSLVMTLIHAHELREIRMVVEANKKKAQQRSQKRRGSLLGKLTGMLRPDHVSKGYCLMEDEDFLYLYLPDDKMPPIVFNAMTTTLPDVIRTICRLEGQDD